MPAFSELCQVVSSGDQVIIPSITCLGYSFSQVCERWEQLRDKGVNVEVLDFPLLQKHEDTFSQFIEYLRQSEQELRRDKQRAGIQQAQKNGVHIGRKPKKIPADFDSYCQAYRDNQISSREAANRLGISHTTFLRWYREKFHPNEE